MKPPDASSTDDVAVRLLGDDVEVPMTLVAAKNLLNLKLVLGKKCDVALYAVDSCDSVLVGRGCWARLLDPLEASFEGLQGVHREQRVAS
jgi:hypothetical protein